MERMQTAAYKIGEGKRKCLSKDMQEIIGAYQEENKKLRAYADNLDSENDNQAIEIEELKKENKNLKEEVKNAECEFGFACEEIDYRKREDKELRKWIKEHVDYQTQADFRKRFEHK